MPSVVCADWTGGINIKADPWKLAPGEWQTLENAITRNGRAEPLKGLGSTVTTIGSSDLYWIFKLGSTWLGGTARRYAVKWEDQYIAYVVAGGAGAFYRDTTTTSSLGLARPTTVSAITPVGGGSITGTSLSWVYTFYDALGQESGPSEPSALTNLTAQNATVTIAASSDPSVVGRKVYRVNNGTYQLAKTVANNVDVSVLDDTPTLSLGDPLLTEDANPAPNLEGLAIQQHQARLWGFTGNSLYYTNVGTPWAWSYAYITIPATIVAAAPAPGGLLVLTSERAYLITGYNEDSFALQTPPNTYGCAAAFSLVQTDMGLVWWDNQGLVLYDGNQFTLLTDRKFDSADIAGFSTTGMHAAYSDGYYYLFHADGTLVCDIRNGATFTTSTMEVNATHVTSDGTVYATDGATVKEWNAGSNLTMTLRTRQFTYEDLRRPFHGRRADVYNSGSVTPQWYRSGIAWGTYSSVPSVNGVSECWSIPGNRGRPDFQVSGTVAVTQIEVNPARR